MWQSACVSFYTSPPRRHGQSSRLLAKPLDSNASLSSNSSDSPTLTAAATKAGVILGTAAYMRPDVARSFAWSRSTIDNLFHVMNPNSSDLQCWPQVCGRFREIE